MLKPKVDNWDENEELDGLLLFAQLIDEMLFDYTIDSYKPPVLNTHSLCEELSEIIDEVKDGFIKEKSIEPLKEELIWSLKNDPAAKSILGNRYSVILDYLKSSNNYNYIISTTNTLKNLLDLNYISEIKKQLIDLVSNPKEKEKLTILTKILISELLSRDYSQQYIYHETKNYFFQTQAITSPYQIEQYLNKYSFESGKYDVLFKGNSNFKHFQDLKLDIQIEINEDKLSPRTDYSDEADYLDENTEYPIFITFKEVEALDPFHARDVAELYLHSINNLASYKIHKARLTWYEKALVYSPSNYVYIIKPPVSPMAKIRDSEMTELPAVIDDLIPIFGKLEPLSAYCIFNSFNFHSASNQTKSYENQLMNLWTALESLLPPPQEQRILHFINSFEPLLSRKYIQKLIIDLLRTLRLNLEEKDLYDIFSKLPSEYTDFEKCAALISIKEKNEDLRKEIYELIGRNPLLRNRIFTLTEKLHSADNILETINLHKERIRWHLQRIYRARNLITHKGEKIFYVEQLVEHLHYYYHTIVDLIQETSHEKHIDSLETIFNLIRIEHEAHMKVLKESKKEKCNYDNFKLFLFGN
jgi:hypothetical protein